MPSVTRIDVLSAELPFRFSFGHALAARRSTTNVYVRMTLSDGSVGFGEGVPRGYVTGETPDGALAALQQRYAPALLGRELADPGEIAEQLAAIADDEAEQLSPGAFCALELACLDAAGRSLGLPVGAWLWPRGDDAVTYDAVLPFMPLGALAAATALARAAGLRRLKLKVGRDLRADLRALEVVRRVAGPDADVRVDANCAWTRDEALAALASMRRHRISAVEQPVAREDLAGLRLVTAHTPEIVIADESACTPADAELLARTRGCDALNIRVSKCGGLLRSLRVARIAREAGMDCVVGAQVGESGILSAAGRHLAASIAPRYVEGSPGPLLLKGDIVGERVLPGSGGRAAVYGGPGLGVTVDEASLRRHGRVHATLTPSYQKVS